MVRAIGDQVEKNPEYLSILDKKAIKNEKIDDDVQKEQVSVMNKLLNDALRAKGYAGPDIKMVLTDVTDPNGPYYTDTLTNTVVFDRKQLASANRDEILNALGHEFGHYSKEDNKTGTQTIANYTGAKLEDRTKAMVAKEATEDTLANIRNNPNVITGEEGRLLAESIPMERREYVKWRRVFRGGALTFLGGFRTVLGISEIWLGAVSSSVGVGVLVVGHGAAQTGFGISDMGEGIHDAYLGFKDVDDNKQQAVRISKKVLGKYEEPLNFAVGATTEQVIVIGQAFYRFPISNMTGNTNSSTKKESSSNVTTKKQKTNNTGTEKVVEDTTTVKTVGSNNKNTVTQTGKNSKEVVLYKDKNSKITVDTKNVSTENNGTTGSTNASQQVNKGTTSNNPKVNVTTKTTEGKNKTTNTSSYVTGIKEDEPNTFLNGKKFEVIEATEGKVENANELLTKKGMAKLKNMTIEDVKKLFIKQGSNPNDIEKVNGKGVGGKFTISDKNLNVFDESNKEMVNIGSVRTNSGASHNLPYFTFGTNKGSIKVVFGDPKKYKYNITNKEKGTIIFVIENKNKKR